MKISRHTPKVFKITCLFCGHDGPCKVEIVTEQNHTQHYMEKLAHAVDALEEVTLVCDNCRQREEMEHDGNQTNHPV